MYQNLKLVTAPHPALVQRSSPVKEVDDSIRELMDNMLELMYKDQGIGLAANQVGVLKRVLVIDFEEDSENRPRSFYPLFIANPEITYYSDKIVNYEEGCLSLPELRINVPRPDEIKLTYLDYNNQKQELSDNTFLARIIQHELDHLNGKLMIDYLSKLKKDAANRRLAKIKRLSA